MTVAKPTADEIRRSIQATVEALCEPGQVVELRVLDVSKVGVMSGYFDNVKELVDAAIDLDGGGQVYLTVNPINPALLARAKNRTKPCRKGDPTTNDRDVVRRRWLLLDFDPVRPAGIASTNAEHQLALDLSTQVRTWLTGLGWPEPVVGDSGNGAHLLYPINLANDAESTALAKQCVSMISQRFETSSVKVDESVFNAARIWRFYGTINRKGDNTAERPHRRAALVSVPAARVEVTVEQLRALGGLIVDEPSVASTKTSGAESKTKLKAKANTKPKTKKASTSTAGQVFDLASWIERHGLVVAKTKPWNDATMYVLAVCPWNSDHTNESAHIIQQASGALSARCFHDGCKGKDWHALRELVEPEWREQQKGSARVKAASSDSTTMFLRGDHSELAAQMLADLRGNASEDLVFADGALFRYCGDSGLWLEVDEDHQARVVINYAGEPVMAPRGPKELKIQSGDVGGARAVAAHLVGNQRFFADAPAGIAFANGFVKWEGARAFFEKLSPSHRARVALPFPYKPNMRPKKFFRFLRQCFKGDANIGAKIRLVCEFVGACLFGIAIHYGKVLVMLGEGSNGKSVLIKIMSALFPREVRASIAPQMFEHEYWKAQLVGIRLNALSELPEADIMNSESFKAIVTGDEVMGRHVKERPFKFTPIAGHVFAANRLPATTDFSHGYWRRLMVVEWNRIFADHQQDSTLAETLIREELPGIAAWFVRGAVRLLQRGRFDIPQCCQAAVDAWRKDADPVSDFVGEATNPASTVSGSDSSAVMATHPWTQSMVLYTAFRIWAGRRGHLSMSIKKFAKRLRSLGIANEHNERGTFYAVALKPLPTDLTRQFACPSCSAVWTPGMEQPA